MRFIYSGQRLGRLSGRFSRAANREVGEPEQRIAAAVQGTAGAEQGTAGTHRRASSRINKRAVCNAITAIFVAFEPAALSIMMIGPGLGRLGKNDEFRVAQPILRTTDSHSSMFMICSELSRSCHV
jgi:hypothetical protein